MLCNIEKSLPGVCETRRGDSTNAATRIFFKNNMVHVTAYTNYVYLSWHVYTRNFLGIATLGCWHKRIQRNIHVRRRDWRLLLFVECCSQVQYERYTFSKLDLGSSSFIISLVVCGIIVTALELASNCVLTSQTTPVYVYAYWLIYFYTNFTTVLWVTDCHLLANASEKLIDRLLVSRVNERTYLCTWKYIGKIHIRLIMSATLLTTVRRAGLLKHILSGIVNRAEEFRTIWATSKRVDNLRTQIHCF